MIPILIDPDLIEPTRPKCMCGGATVCDACNAKLVFADTIIAKYDAIVSNTFIYEDEKTEIARLRVALQWQEKERGALVKRTRTAEARVDYADDVLKAASIVIKAARNPECNYDTERECGLHGDVYTHHPRWCPRGRLIAAIEAYDASVNDTT